MCQGISMCADKGDLDRCSRQERRQDECLKAQKYGGNPNRCNSTGGVPGQCIYSTEIADGETYSCVDRSDENPYLQARGRLQLADVLKDCNTTNGYPGLTCTKGEGGCLWMDYWCQ